MINDYLLIADWNTDMYAEVILWSHIEKVDDVNLPKPVPASGDGKQKTLFSEFEVRYTNNNLNAHILFI